MEANVKCYKLVSIIYSYVHYRLIDPSHFGATKILKSFESFISVSSVSPLLDTRFSDLIVDITVIKMTKNSILVGCIR